MSPKIILCRKVKFSKSCYFLIINDWVTIRRDFISIQRTKKVIALESITTFSSLFAKLIFLNPVIWDVNVWFFIFGKNQDRMKFNEATKILVQSEKQAWNVPKSFMIKEIWFEKSQKYDFYTFVKICYYIVHKKKWLQTFQDLLKIIKIHSTKC